MRVCRGMSTRTDWRGLLGVRSEIAPTNDDPTSNAIPITRSCRPGQTAVMVEPSWTAAVTLDWLAEMA